MTNTNWEEIEEKLNNGTFTNADYSELIDNTLLKINKFLAMVEERILQNYPDINNRPKELQERIDKINNIIREG